MHKSILLSINLLLLIALSYSSKSQSGTYSIPPEMVGKYSTTFLDSMRNAMALKPQFDSNVNYDSLGNLIWFGSSDIEWSSSTFSKLKNTFYICCENGWLKTEIQFDTITKTMDYQVHTPAYNNDGYELWDLPISTTLTDTTHINFHSNIDLTAKIFEQYQSVTPIYQFSIEGNGLNQSFNINLNSNKKYVVVYYSDNKIVYIKRLGV